MQTQRVASSCAKFIKLIYVVCCKTHGGFDITTLALPVIICLEFRAFYIRLRQLRDISYMHFLRELDTLLLYLFYCVITIFLYIYINDIER